MGVPALVVGVMPFESTTFFLPPNASSRGSKFLRQPASREETVLGVTNGYAYFYEEVGRLVRVETNVTRYTVDPIGRRVEKEKSETVVEWLIWQALLRPAVELSADGSLEPFRVCDAGQCAWARVQRARKAVRDPEMRL